MEILMKNKIRNEDGMALVAVLMIMLLMGFIGMGLVDATTSEIKIASNEKSRLNAFYAAERGLEYSRSNAAIYNTIGEGIVAIPLPVDILKLKVGESDVRGTIEFLYEGPPPSGNDMVDGTGFIGRYYVIETTGEDIRDSQVRLQSNHVKILK